MDKLEAAKLPFPGRDWSDPPSASNSVVFSSVTSVAMRLGSNLGAVRPSWTVLTLAKWNFRKNIRYTSYTVTHTFHTECSTLSWRQKHSTLPYLNVLYVGRVCLFLNVCSINIGIYKAFFHWRLSTTTPCSRQEHKIWVLSLIPTHKTLRRYRFRNKMTQTYLFFRYKTKLCLDIYTVYCTCLSVASLGRCGGVRLLSIVLGDDWSSTYRRNTVHNWQEGSSWSVWLSGINFAYLLWNKT